MGRIYLSDIVARKKERLKELNYNLDDLKEAIDQVEPPASFYEAMAKPGLSIVGEIKKASPSKGLIKADFQPVALAKIYEKAVDAISVLTEEDYFQGHADYLKAVSETTALPTLYKDFVIDPIQIYHAKSIGASCVLLIVAILDDETLLSFIELAASLGLDTLVETHTKNEVDRGVKAGAKIIGINNRDLNTFITNIETTLALRQYVPEGPLVISESGIFTPEDIKVLKAANINGVLVGESFMKGDIIAMARGFKEAFQ